MQTKQNPKLKGTCIWDCIPQTGRCPVHCQECFFNRPGAFYAEPPIIPTVEEVGYGIARFNSGNDSNLQKALIIETSKKYRRYFFNTSIPNLDFPGPVVLTANPKEELPAYLGPATRNLMFVRLRVSDTNQIHIDEAVNYWTKQHVPVVLTFMAYYTRDPGPNYEYRVRHVNSYYCPTDDFIKSVMRRYPDRLVSRCMTWCKDCRNCETHYIQTMKRLNHE